ncbi:MAG: hypothetical protein HQ582_31145 [Planctomycetes bacterium]|nr:hypothetical protein [Planctomycetota bacterium]
MILTKRLTTVFGLLSGLLFSFGHAAAAEDQAPAGPEPPRASAGGPVEEPQFPRTYGPLDASRDAYQRAENERRRAIDRQTELNDEMVWYSGHPGFDRDPPGLDTIYAYGPTHGHRRVGRGTVRLGVHFGHFGGYPHPAPYPRHRASRVAPWGVFEPWPFVAGDIYGYPYLDRVEQPLGHKMIRTGPNGYIARPVYASDLQAKEPPPPAADQRAVPEAAVPMPIPPPPESGPREF